MAAKAQLRIMQNDPLETQQGPSTQSGRPFFVIDASHSFENPEDVDMEADALSAIRAYKKETDRLISETYAALAGDRFDLRSASASVQAIWLNDSATRGD